MYIYLDIDGVMTVPTAPLDDETGYLCFTDESVSILKKVLDEFDGKIIISSSWKEYKSLDFLKTNIMKKYGLDIYVTGKTPDISNILRSDEIIEDMKNRGLEKSEIIILDDMFVCEYLSDRVVYTDTFVGLTENHLESIYNMIKGSGVVYD